MNRRRSTRGEAWDDRECLAPFGFGGWSAGFSIIGGSGSCHQATSDCHRIVGSRAANDHLLTLVNCPGPGVPASRVPGAAARTRHWRRVGGTLTLGSAVPQGYPTGDSTGAIDESEQCMRFGILPPVRTGVTTDPQWMTSFARHAEACGFESIVLVEHAVVISDYESTYPYASSGKMPLPDDCPIPDPLDLVAFLAGVTEHITLATGVLVLPNHHAVTLAKRLATVDVLSGGRIRLCVGVGWMDEELRATGADPRRRGARTDETIAAMRTLWSDAGPSGADFDGEFFTFHHAHSFPKPVRSEGCPSTSGGTARPQRGGQEGWATGFSPWDCHLSTSPSGWIKYGSPPRKPGESGHHRALLVGLPPDHLGGGRPCCRVSGGGVSGGLHLDQPGPGPGARRDVRVRRAIRPLGWGRRHRGSSVSRPSMSDGDQPYERWVVEEELRTLSTDYATAVDGRDGEGLAGLFVADGALVVPRYPEDLRPVITRSGHQELRRVPEGLKRYQRTFHQLTNHRYQVVGPLASGEVLCVAHHLSAPRHPRHPRT